MSLYHFLRKHARARTSPRHLASAAVREANRRLNGTERQRPVHLPDHRRLVNDFLADTPAWVIVLDAGRFDLFAELAPEFFDGDLRPAWNGGVGYTGDWFNRTLSGDYPGLGCFSWSPIRGFNELDYDAREHFGVAPDIQPDRSPEQKLRDLGYLDAPDRNDSPPTADSPQLVNRSVRRHAADINGGVVRYIKPHPPLTGLESMTTGRGKAARVRAALDSGELDAYQLASAYIDTYREGLEAAAELVPDLPGSVALTADHGTCLYCGQLFHGRNFEKHAHLTTVPWMVVE